MDLEYIKDLENQIKRALDFKKNIKDLKICIKKGELIDRITKRIITGRSFTSIIIR